MNAKAKICWTCHQEKPLALFTKDKAKRDGFSGRCAECSRKANRAANLDRVKSRARVRRYRDAHPDWEAARRIADREASAIRLKKWAEENKEKHRLHIYNKTARRRATRLNATPSWANHFFIKEAYHLAKLRTEATGFKWHVDHILPLNSPIVCGLHVEHNLQVIPAVVNRQKGNKLEELSWPY